MAEGFACFRTSALAALPALVFAGLLAARALPLRPLAAGALYGLGAGLMSDAGLRLYCDYSVLSHVLFAHMGAVAGVTIAGAVLASDYPTHPAGLKSPRSPAGLQTASRPYSACMNG